MKKLAVFWVIGAALAFALPDSFGEVHGAGGMHGHEGHAAHAMHDHGHDFHEHGHFRGHDRVIIGFPFWWVPPAYYNPPRYIYEQPPAVFIDQDSNYWYYCPDPVGYYPNVQNCPIGWLRVVPDPASR